jgi:hypothetical protein
MLVEPQEKAVPGERLWVKSRKRRQMLQRPPWTRCNGPGDLMEGSSQPSRAN